ncbi:MAG: polyamine aminopropyltransferase [Deltaproteobacteria bacterium]|nr:polyamine aminopropyltransferase [Deltaproteobacteria bacterium]
MNNKEEWFSEGTVPGKRYGKIEHCFLMEELILREQTDYQSILIFDNSVYGRILVLDDIVQFSTSDEFIYHEMITHPVMLSHPDPRRILIVGGGDGGTLRECLRHNPEHVSQVEIDKRVIDVSRKYFPSISQGGFADSRVTLSHEDGKDFIKKYENHFDIVIIDCSDPVGPSLPLFEAEFYKDIFKALKADGMASFQVGSFLDPALISETFSNLGQIFPSVVKIRLTMPSYHCGEYCFMGASKDILLENISMEHIEKRYKELNQDGALKYYSPGMHQASQTIPGIYGV